MSLFLVKSRVDALIKIGNKNIAYSEFFNNIDNNSFLVFPTKFIGKHIWDLYMNGKTDEFVHFGLWDEEGNYRASDGVHDLSLDTCRIRLCIIK
jgi:hypothetical protein